MKRAFLHIGTGKTGTTTIQRSCASSRSLIENGIEYPLFDNFRGQKNQNCLSLIYKTFEKLPRIYKSKFYNKKSLFLEESARIRRAFLEELNKSDNMLFSAEYFANFSLHEIESLRSDFHRFGFEEIGVLIYVRDPISYYVSNVQQRIKASHLIEDPKKFRYPFKKYIERWLKIFPGLITVLPYNAKLLDDPGLLQSFESELARFFGLRGFSLPHVRNQNTSMSLESFVILQEFRRSNHSNSNNVFSKDSEELRKLLDDCDESTRTPMSLRDKYKHTIVSNHLNDLDWLNREFHVEPVELVQFNSGRAVDRGTTDPSELFNSYSKECIFNVYSQLLTQLLKSNKA